MDDLSGQVIRGYELRERIGAGGFGAVYRAFQSSVGREVAVKIILPEHARQPEFVQRFHTEARLIARLEHFHIVPLYDFWQEDDGSAYLVMRYLRGGSLRHVIRKGPILPEMAARILEQTSQALAVAHGAGVIHRDIKPDNILLDEQGNAYLSDFGIAKDLISSVHLTLSGTLGTPAYAAPEQINGDPVSPQTDIYSLGITLYECLAGEHPFPRSFVQHLTTPLPRLTARRGDLPEAVDLVLQQATAKSPADRFADVRAFAEAFQRALKGETGIAGPPSDMVTMPEQGLPPGNALQDALEGPTIITREPPGGTPPTPALPRDEAQPTALGELTPHVPAGDPVAALITALHDVPARPRRLFGRDDLLTVIDGYLDEGQRVLLQGLGGMGKTTLAAEVVARRIEAGKGPTLWLRVGNDAAQTVIESLTRAFGANLVLTQDNLQTQAVRGLLVQQGIRLLVLDDVWNDATLGRIMEVLPRDLPVLVTSRQRYPLDRIVDVGELAAGDALALLRYHAGLEADDDGRAEELCERLGWHPFALEIAGKTMQVDDLTPDELLQRIADAPHLITMMDGFAEEGRASIDELLTASVDTVDDEARATFFAFGGLFVAEATPDLLARCLGRDVRALDASMTTLIRRGLVRRERLPRQAGVRYRLHELAYSYARAHTTLDRQAVIEACRSYATDHAQDIAALDAERINLLKAAEAASDQGAHEALIAILRALTVDGPYFQARGYDSLLLRALDAAIEAARAGGESQAEILHYLLGKRGDAYYGRGKLDEALAAYLEALGLARKLKMPQREVILLSVTSKIHSDRHDFEAAEQVLDEARRLADELGDDRLVARVLENQGYLYAHAKGDFKAARAVFRQQVTLAEAGQDAERLFYALLNLGAAELMLEDAASALEHLKRALALAEEHDHYLWVGHALYPMGAVYHQLGDREQAQGALSRALSMFRKVGNEAKAKEVREYMLGEGYTVTED